MSKLSPILSGIAGEYLTAGELSRRGFIASVTLKNSKGVDILVTNSGATKTLGIQVKTNQDSLKWWLLDKKAENFFADHLFYVFVNLNSGRAPDFFIVPSKTVAKAIKENHKPIPGVSPADYDPSVIDIIEDLQPKRRDQAHEI